MKRVLIVICLILLLSGNVFAADAKGVAVDVLSKTSVSWDGKALPDYTNAKPEITILRIKIPPGAVLPMHKHGVINAGVLLSGELTVITEEGRTLHLKEGQAIVEVVNTWHYGKNEGNKLAEIIVFYAGKADTLITVNQ
jgi:quercetin dioxygenase-like cupin family protein